MTTKAELPNLANRRAEAMLDSILFRELPTHEVHSFKQYVHTHWVMDMKPKSIWHPVVRKEWEIMQELSVTVEKLYKEMQPEINSMISCVDPISPEAWGATVDILTNVLNSQDTWDTINTEHFALWENLPTEAQQTMIGQVTRRYF